MSDPFSDQYWRDEFTVTTADLERLGDFMAETRQAHDLTALAQRIVRGRLRHGTDLTDPALKAASRGGERVRLWDPSVAWELGDRVIVAVGVAVEGRTIHAPYVGEIVSEQDNKVRIQIDALNEHRDYSVAESSENLQKWRKFVENLVRSRRGSQDENTQMEYVLLRFGERLVTQVLNALKQDSRFIELDGRWFLRQLAAFPTEEQLGFLAWKMVPFHEPRSTVDLVSLIQPPLAAGDAGVFGLYLALRQYPALFGNADPGLRPRWRLVGPPPGAGMARNAAYDPATYTVLCMPGETLAPELVARLWNLELLEAII